MRTTVRAVTGDPGGGHHGYVGSLSGREGFYGLKPLKTIRLSGIRRGHHEYTGPWRVGTALGRVYDAPVERQEGRAHAPPGVVHARVVDADCHHPQHHGSHQVPDEAKEEVLGGGVGQGWLDQQTDPDRDCNGGEVRRPDQDVAAETARVVD